MRKRGGFQLFTIRGIPIRVHYSFLLVLPILAYLFGQSFVAAANLAGVPPSDLSGPPWAWGLAVALTLFASVLVHELAHSLYAIAHGGKVQSITLLMIGGVSELSKAPEDPKQEAIMALAGPAASLGIGGVCMAVLWVSTSHGGSDLRFALFYLGQLNMVLAVFNLLPAFPMDGGRILRAILVPGRGKARATHIAATVGKIFAGLFALVGLFAGNFFLVIIAFFVFIGAEGELRAELTRVVLGELKVGELMSVQLDQVAPTETLYAVGERMLSEKRLSFPVVDHGHVLGTVGLDSVERLALDVRRHTSAGQAMTPAAIVAPTARVADVLRFFVERRTNSLAVVDGDRFVGTISRFDVTRALRLQGLLSTQHPGSMAESSVR
jgi:Zn-dependent protease